MSFGDIFLETSSQGWFQCNAKSRFGQSSLQLSNMTGCGLLFSPRDGSSTFVRGWEVQHLHFSRAARTRLRGSWVSARVAGFSEH